MTVNIEQIKKLREVTGVSMMSCKKALEESAGDFEGAIALLRKKGEAKAADRTQRSTREGAVFILTEGGKTGILQLLCETDFVARSDDFLNLGNSVLKKLLGGQISESDLDLQDIKDAVFRLGENIQIGSMKLLSGNPVGTYVHSNHKIGVVVVLNRGDEHLAKDIAMHAAATNPLVVSPDEVTAATVEKEKEIWRDQLAQEGKPADIIEKIMMGKEKKFREENALIAQNFVKNSEKTVGQLLTENDANIVGFVRYQV